MFDGGTPVTTWWVGLIDSASYTALAATDDYADINQTNNGWKEFTNYTDTANSGSSTTRPAWGGGACLRPDGDECLSCGGRFTAPGTVKGLFLVGGIANAQNKNNHDSLAEHSGLRPCSPG